MKSGYMTSLKVSPVNLTDQIRVTKDRIFLIDLIDLI